MFKRFILLFFVTCFLLCGQNAWARMVSFAEYVYRNVQNGNIEAVYPYLQRGYSIDAADRDGMSALCRAVQRNDRITYQRLIRLGASRRQACLTRIVQERRGATTKTVIRQNNDNKALYIGAGILAVGAVAALALSGGGGSKSHGGSSKPIVCPEGKKLVDSECVDICPTWQRWTEDGCVDRCPADQYWTGTECEDRCPADQYWTGTECEDRCPAEQYWTGTECEDRCPADQRWTGTECEDRCPADQRWTGTECEDRCPTDQYWTGTECEDRCPADQRWTGTECVDRCSDDQQWTGTECVDRCPADQRWTGTECVDRCPADQQWTGTECEDRCPPHQRWTGTGCEDMCPVGQRWTGTECEDIICPEGQRLDGDDCVDIICPAGQKLEGSTCVDLVCGEGEHIVGNACVPIECPEGTYLAGSECVAVDTCPIGQRWNGHECEDLECPEGSHLEGDICLSDTACPSGQRWNGKECEDMGIVCPLGTHIVGSKCVADGVNVDQVSDDNLYGIASDNEDVFNLYSIPRYPEKEASILLKNKGNGNVYGMYGYRGQVFNSYVFGYDSLGNTNREPIGHGYIDITDNGTGEVYGMYSHISDIMQYKEAINATAFYNGNAYGNIDIKHSGGGNTYGIVGDVRAYNAYISYGGNAYGTVNIEGDGNIYGIYGYVAATNIVSHGNGNYGRGDLNIRSTGDGDIYGMAISRDDIPGAGAGGGGYASWFAFNAYTDGGTVDGNMNIHNIGHGNVYGMYGGQQLYNTYADRGLAVGKINITNLGDGDVYGMYLPDGDGSKSYNAYVSINGGSAEGNIDIYNTGQGNVYGMQGREKLYNAMLFGTEYGKSVGNINITNMGNGDVYGMYMPDEDDYGIIGNMNENGSQSYINLINAGSGTVTGLKGGKNVSIINSGEININNAGSGTAVGIYGEEGADINNSGTINIYRDSFVHGDDETYEPATAVGGTAYGIYAEKNVVVDNSGTINISGAADGAGIYLEDGAVLTNTGVVRFNDEDNSVVSAGEIVDVYNVGRTASNKHLSLGGSGEVVLGENGKFFADKLSGSLGVSDEVVLGSDEDEYVVQSALKVKDISELDIKSKSALFDASLKDDAEGGYDVVLERKKFTGLLKNRTLARFFEENYVKGSDTELYDELKKTSDVSLLRKKVANIAGTDVLPQYRLESTSVIRRLGQQFNDNLFNHPLQNYIGGYKYIDISRESDGDLVGSDGTAHAAYGMLKAKNDAGITYGLGATIAQLKTDYDNKSTHKSNIFGLWAPVGYQFNTGTQWFSKLYAGYEDGSYDRYNTFGKFSGDVKSYQYGLTNELRHKLHLGGGFSFVPTAELNLLGIYQKNIDEGLKNQAIYTDAGNSLSLEGGLGAYMNKEFLFGEQHSLGMQIGGIYYVEFLDPDEGVDAGIRGMRGKYKLSYSSDDRRSAFSLRVNYNYYDLMLYGSVEKDTENSKDFTIDAGLQYNL